MTGPGAAGERETRKSGLPGAGETRTGETGETGPRKARKRAARAARKGAAGMGARAKNVNCAAPASSETPLSSVLGVSSAAEPGLHCLGTTCTSTPSFTPTRSCPGISHTSSSPRTPSIPSTSILRASTSSTTSS